MQLLQLMKGEDNHRYNTLKYQLQRKLPAWSEFQGKDVVSIDIRDKGGSLLNYCVSALRTWNCPTPVSSFDAAIRLG